MSRSPEPFASLKGKLREGEGSLSMGSQMLRFAQHDNTGFGRETSSSRIYEHWMAFE